MGYSFKKLLEAPEYAAKVERIRDLRCKGWTTREIGQDSAVQLSHTQVSNILSHVSDIEYDKLLKKLANAKRQKLMAIERQRRELWDAWLRSQGRSTERQKEEVDTVLLPNKHQGSNTGKRKYNRKSTIKIKPGRDGGIRFMSEITKLQRLKCKILGLLTPQRSSAGPGKTVLYVPIAPGIPKGNTTLTLEFSQLRQKHDPAQEDIRAIPKGLAPPLVPSQDPSQT